MDAGRWRPGVKRRRFRNPLLLAAAALLAGLLVTYACANGVWRAVSGAASPSLLGVVSGSVSELMQCCRTGCAARLSWWSFGLHATLAVWRCLGGPRVKCSGNCRPHQRIRRTPVLLCAPNLQVNSYLNFLPAGYGGSKHHGGASTVAARQALDTLEQVRTRGTLAHSSNS